jgi:hypothetical protein
MSISIEGRKLHSDLHEAVLVVEVIPPLGIIPDTALILAGTSNLTGNTGFAKLDVITKNYASMAELNPS